MIGRREKERRHERMRYGGGNYTIVIPTKRLH